MTPYACIRHGTRWWWCWWRHRSINFKMIGHFQVSNHRSLGLPEKLLNRPVGFTSLHFHSYIFPVLTSLISYHDLLDKPLQVSHMTPYTLVTWHRIPVSHDTEHTCHMTLYTLVTWHHIHVSHDTKHTCHVTLYKHVTWPHAYLHTYHIMLQTLVIWYITWQPTCLSHVAIHTCHTTSHWLVTRNWNLYKWKFSLHGSFHI